MGEVSETLWNVLMCPECKGPLRRSEGGAQCVSCSADYDYSESDVLDLRLQRPKTLHYEFTLGTSLLRDPGFDFSPLPLNPAPPVDFSGVPVPRHLSRRILSHFPKAKTENSFALDLGCGSAIHRQVCEHAGFHYVGMDYESKHASVLGDAHALPFEDESFEFVLSIAVLEHIRFPFVMMKEANRVLKPGGLFIGTVAFLEPFHGDSFYHHTHLGAYNSLQEGGFEIERICPSDTWPGLVAQAQMALFPKMSRKMSKSIVMPIQLLHRLWWKMGGIFSSKASEDTRLRSTTGAFYFMARKGSHTASSSNASVAA